MQTVSDLICSARGIEPEPGSLQGTCIYCGRHTDAGHEFKPSGQFTTYQLVQGGDCICPACWVMKREKFEYRASMWAVNPTTFVKFKPAEALEHLCEPPEPPFAIYFTRTWKRQGWVNLLTRVNYSRDRFIVGMDYGLIDVDAGTRDGYLTLIADALAAGATKTELETGQFRPKTYAKVGDPDVIHELQSHAGEPLWSLCVYVSRYESPKKAES